MMPKNASSVAKATDSGIEDTASYLEPSSIQLRESEFQEIEDIDGSTMEGSVVDADYGDRMATKTANGRTAKRDDSEQADELQRTSRSYTDNADEVERRDRPGRRRT